MGAASDLASEQMMVDEASPKVEEDKKTGDEGAEASAGEKKEKESKKEGDVCEEEKKEEKEPEPTEEILNNPCRVLKGQMQYISFPKEIDGAPVRYTPLLENRRVGFLLLNDTRPEEPEELFLEQDKPQDDDEKEPEPPEPFEWTD